MKPWIPRIPLAVGFWAVILIFLGFSRPGMCLSDRDMAQLKENGVGEETIAALIREKSIETCAFTVQEIIRLKQAGVSGKSLRVLIAETSFMKESQPIVYGSAFRKRRFPSVAEIIALKDAGVSDTVIQALIPSDGTDASRSEREKAWEMLQNMNLMVDQR